MPYFTSYSKCTHLKDMLGDLIDFFKYLKNLFDLEVEPINKVCKPPKTPNKLNSSLDFKQRFAQLRDFPLHIQKSHWRAKGPLFLKTR